MNVTTIIADLARRGVTVEAWGDKLRLAPASAISSELRSLLLEHKAELLTALSTSADQAPLVAPWDRLTRPPDPQARLVEYLNAWAGMDEAAWPEANVKALYDDIMDIFKAHPEAERWFREWRKAHPEARLV
jgi:hypothetical protein